MNAVTPLHPEPEVVAIDKLADALAKAQTEIQNPRFDSENPHFKSKFASLAAVRNAIVPVFAKYGLSILQDLTTSERGIACTTLILHSSGQRLVLGPLVMPATKQDAQGLGSAATYARRYALLAAAGVAGEEDDDGNAASKEKPPTEKTITESQAADLRALIQEVGETEERFLKWAQAKSLETLPAKLLQQSVKKLNSKKAGNGTA